MKPPVRQARERAVRIVLFLTQGTTLAPDAHERELLVQYIDGDLSLDQLTQLLATAQTTG